MCGCPEDEEVEVGSVNLLLAVVHQQIARLSEDRCLERMRFMQGGSKRSHEEICRQRLAHNPPYNNMTLL